MNYEQLIDKLAEKLSVPAAHLWAILVRQARIEAALSAFWILFGVIVLVTFLRTRERVAVWADAKDGEGYRLRDAELVMGAYWIGGGIISLVATIIALVQVNYLVAYLFNPEYYALQQILGAVR